VNSSATGGLRFLFFHSECERAPCRGAPWACD
jgi:hypothetical protein